MRGGLIRAILNVTARNARKFNPPRESHRELATAKLHCCNYVLNYHSWFSNTTVVLRSRVCPETLIAVLLACSTLSPFRQCCPNPGQFASNLDQENLWCKVFFEERNCTIPGVNAIKAVSPGDHMGFAFVVPHFIRLVKPLKCRLVVLRLLNGGGLVSGSVQYQERSFQILHQPYCRCVNRGLGGIARRIGNNRLHASTSRSQ